MSTSYMDIGGATSGKAEAEKKRQFWMGAFNETKQAEQKSRQLGPDLGLILMAKANEASKSWAPLNYNEEKLELNAA